MIKLFFNIIILSALCISIFSSCTKQRGCTNKNAVNFNVTADEDDGTCIVCHTIKTDIDSVKIYLKDKKFGSPHYNQLVARYSLIQRMETPSDKVCGKEISKVSLKIESLVTQNMYFNYSINRFSGPVYISYYDNVIIDAGDSVSVGTIVTFNNPPFLIISLDSLTVSSSDITYYN